MNLAELQREMAAAVMLPLTADERHARRGSRWPPMGAVADSFIAPNSRLTAFERLEIYNRQYWFRVLGALAEDFPALRAVVGGSAFEALSIAYLTEHPSRSFSMRNLGSKLAEWLASNPQFAGRRQRLAVDVARIEWAFVEAFDSADRAPLTLDQIATLDAGSRLALQPHLQLIALDLSRQTILVLALHDRQKRETSEAGLKHEEGLSRAGKAAKTAAQANLGCSPSRRPLGLLPPPQAGGVPDAGGHPPGLAVWPRRSKRDFATRAFPKTPSAEARSRVVCQLGRTGLDLRSRTRIIL